MRECKSSGTVRGLGIAVLVFTVLCLLTCFAFIPLVGEVGDYIASHPDEISAEINEAVMDSSSESSEIVTEMQAEINGTKVDLIQLEAAFGSSSNPEVAEFANFLSLIDTGDFVGLNQFLEGQSESSLILMRDSIASLTDDELATMAASTSGITVAQLQTLRDNAKGISDQDIKDLARYVGPDGLGVMLGDMSTLVVTFLIGLLVAVIVLNVIVLIGCILAIANARKPKKLMAAFVLAIIGAVVCFLIGAWVRCVLEIILAVYISKVRSWGSAQDAIDAQQGAPMGFSGNQSMPSVLR